MVVVVVVVGWVLSKAVEPCTEQFNQRYKKETKNNQMQKIREKEYFLITEKRKKEKKPTKPRQKSHRFFWSSNRRIGPIRDWGGQKKKGGGGNQR